MGYVQRVVVMFSTVVFVSPPVVVMFSTVVFTPTGALHGNPLRAPYVGSVNTEVPELWHTFQSLKH